MKRTLRLLVLIGMMTALFAQDLSPKYTVLKSAVLPGWGELSYKSNSGYIFLGTEAALWLSFAGLRYSGHVQNLDLINYATLNAGVGAYPDNNEYWADLGNYMSYEDHEEDMLENRYPDNVWSSDYHWEWTSEDELLVYEDLFRKKELTLLASEFALTGMIVNRIASVINVRYLKNKQMNVNAYAVPVNGGGYLQVALNF